VTLAAHVLQSVSKGLPAADLREQPSDAAIPFRVVIGRARVTGALTFSIISAHCRSANPQKLCHDLAEQFSRDRFPVGGRKRKRSKVIRAQFAYLAK
jgi:hypothetical protein